MTTPRAKLASTLIIVLTLFMLAGPSRMFADGQSSPGATVVGVWSSACGSSNITITNPSCPSLAVGREFSVEINVTNAPAFNAYAFFLYYDPAFINATRVDVTGTVFASPFIQLLRFLPLGTVHLEATNNAGSFTGANGIIAHVIFKVLAVGVSPLALAAGIAQSNGFAYTQLVNVSTYIELETSDGYFKNDPSRLGPVASFTYNPSNPELGDEVTFDASASYDPDGILTVFRWDFGDGHSETTRFPTIVHSFRGQGNAALGGNFSVWLTALDNATGPTDQPCNTGPCFQGMFVKRVEVVYPPFHDLEINGLTVNPQRVSPGDKVTVRVIVANRGYFSENFNLTVEYGHEGGSLIGQLGSESLRSIGLSGSETFSYMLDTTGLTPGFYSIDTNVRIRVDNSTANNEASETLQVLGEQPQSSSPLYVAIAVVAVIAALVTVGLLLRRRRRAREAE